MVLLKKAQTETFGLLIIVILIVFIAIFAIRLTIVSQPVQNNNIKDSIIANNVVTSLTKVTICEGQQLPSILRNCHNEVNSCNEDSCQLLARELSEMLNKAGFEPNNYKFTASTKENELVNLGNCNIQSREVITSTPYQLYLEGNSVQIKMSLCK